MPKRCRPAPCAARRSNRPPGRGLSARPKVSGCSATTRPSRLRSRARPSIPEERVLRPGLEAARKLLRRQRDQRLRVDPEGIVGAARERARDEHLEARHGKPLRPRKGLARPVFRVAPVRPGAGVEEDADDRKVEGGAGHPGGVHPGRHRDDAAPAVEPAGREMAPAGVEGDIERRVVLPDRCDDLVGGGAEAVEVDREVREPSGKAALEQRVRALAHGSRREQASRGVGRGRAMVVRHRADMPDPRRRANLRGWQSPDVTRRGSGRGTDRPRRGARRPCR